MEENRKKAIFISYDGAVIGCDGLVPYLINGLYQITTRSDYELVLIVRENDDYEDVLALLKKEGIVFDQIVSSFSGVSEYSFARSFVVSDNKCDVENALELGMRAFVFQTLNQESGDLSSSVISGCGNWLSVASYLTDDKSLSQRKSFESRTTKETCISLDLNLDGVGNSNIKTGIGFFDHMLEQIARHSKFDVSLSASGDLDVDEHHTIEDCAIVLGTAVKNALADKRGIERYGFEIVAMDEVAATVALDFSGRPELVWNVEFTREYIGDFPTELFKHFFRSFSVASASSLYISIDSSGDNHHMAEAIFKAFGRALRHGVKRIYGDVSLPSTKGVL